MRARILHYRRKVGNSYPDFFLCRRPPTCDKLRGVSYVLLTLKKAAEHIHVPERELMHLAQRDEVPCIHRGEEFFFEHRLLDEWAQRRLLGLSTRELKNEHREATDERRKGGDDDVLVADLLRRDAILTDLCSRTRGGVIRDMADLAAKTGLIYDPDAYYKELVAREDAASTAIGGGAAFLHAKFHDPYFASESFIALARTRQPIFFGSQDDEGTDIFFLVCCTDHTQHLHVLARLCLLAHGSTLLPDLRVAPDADTMYAILVRAEESLLGIL